MNYANNVIVFLAITSFSGTNTSAMLALADQPLSHYSKCKFLYKTPSRFFRDKTDKQSTPIHYKTKKHDINKILETPIIAKEKPVFYDLPKGFFIEDREDVVVERINDRLFHVHQNITLEKE